MDVGDSGHALDLMPEGSVPVPHPPGLAATWIRYRARGHARKSLHSFTYSFFQQTFFVSLRWVRPGRTGCCSGLGTISS